MSCVGGGEHNWSGNDCQTPGCGATKLIGKMLKEPEAKVVPIQSRRKPRRKPGGKK